MDDTLRVFRSEEGRARFLAAYDAAVRAWPQPSEEIDIPTRLGRTHVIASGPRDAPPVVLLHSLAASAAVWRPNAGALSERFRVYAVDIVGQVGKSEPSRQPIDRADITVWLNDVLDGLGIARASLVGCSYGGFLALNQAVLAPERVDRVVLISPAATFVAFSFKFYFQMLVMGRIRRVLRRGKPVTRMPDGTNLDTSEPANGVIAAAMASSARPILVPAIVFPKKELAAIRAPVLLLIGEKEVLYDPRATLALAKRRVPGLTGAIIPNAPHMAALACPDAANAKMLAFLTAAQ